MGKKRRKKVEGPKSLNNKKVKGAGHLFPSSWGKRKVTGAANWLLVPLHVQMQAPTPLFISRSICLPSRLWEPNKGAPGAARGAVHSYTYFIRTHSNNLNK